MPPRRLTDALQKDAAAGRIGRVASPGGGPFFEHNGLLFLSPQEVTDTTAQLASARARSSTNSRRTRA